jgi:hypothetical protein
MDNVEQVDPSLYKRLHFGLGDAKKADIEIWWPSGARQRLSGVDVDRFLNVEEPK